MSIMKENNKADLDNEKDSLSTCQKERDEYKEKFLRSVADFENFKRRSEQERLSLVDLGKKSVLLDLLPIMSDFERALDQKTTDHGTQGLELIHKALDKMLKNHGVTEITDHTIFNPEVHEALVHIESKEQESGRIVEVIQKGYTYKETLLQPAKVTVAK
jgi:molecular chaperone GrpE